MSLTPNDFIPSASSVLHPSAPGAAVQQSAAPVCRRAMCAAAAAGQDAEDVDTMDLLLASPQSVIKNRSHSFNRDPHPSQPPTTYILPHLRVLLEFMHNCHSGGLPGELHLEIQFP